MHAVFFITEVLLWSMAASSQCPEKCARSSLMVNYGFDAGLRVLEIDVGSCGPKEPLKDCNLESSDKDKYPDSFNNVRNRPAISETSQTYSETSHDSSCNQSCVPGGYDFKPYSNRTSAFMVSVVTSCRLSNPECDRCRNTPLWVTAFPGSPFETAVDVGSCEGTCSETAEKCVATKSKKLAVYGPNGATTVEQTVKCGCEQRKCYTEDYYESYWEVVDGSTEGNKTVVREKFINVGRCRGDCDGIITRKTCLVAAEKSCIFFIGGTKACCNPENSIVHNFMGTEGHQMSVAAVTSCKCS